jgi:hypothetical protein
MVAELVKAISIVMAPHAKTITAIPIRAPKRWSASEHGTSKAT